MKRSPTDRSPGNARRKTFLIDPTGRVAKVYSVGDIEPHPEQVLADLDELLPRAS